MIYIIIFLCLILIVMTFYCIKFGLLILRVQDTLEEALDVIDEKYASMTNIMERPLFYDSPEVKQVVNDIKASRAALHKIAFSLSENFTTLETVEQIEDVTN